MTARERSLPDRASVSPDAPLRLDVAPRKIERDPPFIPRGLSRIEAARYVGVSPTLFDQLVLDGRMPPPKHINRRNVWDRLKLDVAFDAIEEESAAENDPYADVAA